MNTQAQPEFITDSRESAWQPFIEMCHRLSGDPVLIPVGPTTITRDDLIKLSAWDELDEADLPRLAILTDSFRRFIGHSYDVSVLTIWREGTPMAIQIGGMPCEPALDAIQDVLCGNAEELVEIVYDDEPLPPDPIQEKLAKLAEKFERETEERHAKETQLEAGPLEVPPKAANDNVPAKASGPLLKVVNPADWQGKPIPSRDWFLPDLIPARNVTLLSGDGGMGKSLLALQIGVASALGAEALGLQPQPGRVFYLGAEDEEGEFHRRIADILTSHRCGPAQLGDNFRLSPMAGEDATLALPNNKNKQMEPTAMMAALIQEITTYEPDLLVLDTSADLFGGEEINRVQVRQFVGMLRKIAMSIDCAVLLLSHPSLSGMQSGSGLSGSTAWNNSVRSRLYLTGVQDDDDARRLTTVKSNYGRKGGDINLRWHDGAFALDDGKPTMVAGLIARRDDELFRDLLSAINRTGQRVAPTKGVNYAPSIMTLRPEAKGTSKKAMEAAMHRLLAEGLVKVILDGPPSKQRQRLIVSAEDFGPDREAA